MVHKIFTYANKFTLQKKKFEILSEGSPDYRRFTYFAQTEDLAKNLLWICRTTHHFHMANQNRVADLKKLELDGMSFKIFILYLLIPYYT